MWLQRSSSKSAPILELMTQAVVAARGGTATPCLVPETTTCSDDSDLLKAA